MFWLSFREIDFVNETVRTIAGDGSKGSDYSGGRKDGSQVGCPEQVIHSIILYFALLRGIADQSYSIIIITYLFYIWFKEIDFAMFLLRTTI